MTTVLNIETIPKELKALPQWVGWRRELDAKGKLTKVPYQAKNPGTKASTTDPKTWASFPKALAVCTKFDGIGFVLTATDPFTGVDLDHCLDPKTGVIEPWALAIVDQLHSYTERSPSSTGLRIFVRGTLPPGRRKKGPIEFYADERYLTITGDHLPGTPRTIEDRHTTLQLVHAAHFPPPSSNGNGTRPPQPITADD